MKIKLSREIFDAQLPAAPCPQDLREKLDTVTQEYGVSAAAIIRVAVDIFLSQHLSEIEVTNPRKKRGKRNAQK